MAAAIFYSPDGRVQRDGAVSVLGHYPARAAVRHQAHVERRPASAWAYHCCEPQILTFADQVDRSWVEIVGKFLDSLNIERRRSSREPAHQASEDCTKPVHAKASPFNLAPAYQVRD